MFMAGSNVVGAYIASECKLCQHLKMTKSAYHHGNLAPALIDAALKQVERGGAETLSLRDLAQSLGVSRAAPYRHFPDRDALLATVAARGFEDLVTLYEAALEGPGDGPTRLRAAGRAFYDFATKRPGLYRLMFESDFLNRPTPPAILLAPAEKSYRLLWRLVADAYPEADETEVKVRTIIMISTGHGFLTLDHVGRFRPFMYEPLTHDEMVEAVMRAAMGVPIKGPKES
jgi:AcrR family transcriptional regulator